MKPKPLKPKELDKSKKKLKNFARKQKPKLKQRDRKYSLKKRLRDRGKLKRRRLEKLPNMKNFMHSFINTKAASKQQTPLVLPMTTLSQQMIWIALWSQSTMTITR